MGARHLGSVPALDGIRGLAVLLVVLTHVHVFYGSTWWIPNGGFLGVDLFFVLSGFLITALLLEEHGSRGEIRLGAFYARRALRLLPALWVFLAAHLVFAAHATKAPYDLDRALGMVKASLLYVNNWYVIDDPLGHGYGDLGHLWSLAVEEQFYVVWPVLLIALLAVGRRRVAIGVIAALILLVAVWRAYRFATWPDDRVRWYVDLQTGTQYRVDSLLVGALSGWLWSSGRIPTQRLRGVASIATGFIALCVLVIDDRGDDYDFVFLGGYTLFAVAAAIVVLAAVDTDWSANRFLSLAPLRGVGIVSYGVYLWHNAAAWATEYYGQTISRNERLVLFLGATIALTAASWFLVERPALRLKRRFERRSVPAGTGDVPAAIRPATLPTA